MTCNRLMRKTLGFLLAAGMLAAVFCLPGPAGAADRPVILLGEVRNDTGDPGQDWIGDAIVFFLRWHLEPAAALEPAFGAARGTGKELMLSGSYRVEGTKLIVTVALGGPAAKAPAERVLTGSSADPAAVLSGLNSALGEILPAALRGKLRAGVPSANGRAVREFVRAEAGDDLAVRAAAYGSVLQLDPGFTEALWRLGEVAYLRGDYGEALARFGAYRDRFPASGPVHNNLGMSLIKLGRAGDALAEFRKASELDPGSLEARYNLARALTSLGRLDEAEAEYRGILKRQPAEERAVLELAFIRERRGEHAAALELLGGLPGGAGKPSAEYFYNMGLRAWEAQDATGAQVGFRLAMAMDPGDYFARLASGVVRYQEGDHAGAVRELEEAARLRDDDPDLYRYLGLAHQGLGQTGSAAEDFRRSAELLAGQSSAAELRRLLAGGRGAAPAEGAATPMPAALPPGPSPLAEELERSHNRVKQLEAEMGSRDERLAAAAADSSRLKGELDAALSRVSALEGGNAALRQAASAAEAQVKALRDLDAGQGREQGGPDGEAAGLRTQLAERESALDAAAVALKKQVAEVAALRAELQERKKRLGELEAALQKTRKADAGAAAPKKTVKEARDKEYDKTMRETLYGAAVYRHNQGDEEAAAQILEQLLKSRSEDADAWYLLGAVHTARRDFTQARAAYDKAWRLYRRPVSKR